MEADVSGFSQIIAISIDFFARESPTSGHNKNEAWAAYASPRCLTVVRITLNSKGGIMGAVHACSMEAAVPHLLSLVENFSRFQTTRMRITLHYPNVGRNQTIPIPTAKL